MVFGRLTPLVRSFVSIPAGARQQPLGPYVVLTSLIWWTAFGIAGHALGSNRDSVHHAFRYADCAAVALLIAGAALLARSRRATAA